MRAVGPKDARAAAPAPPSLPPRRPRLALPLRTAPAGKHLCARPPPPPPPPPAQIRLRQLRQCASGVVRVGLAGKAKPEVCRAEQGCIRIHPESLGCRTDRVRGRARLRVARPVHWERAMGSTARAGPALLRAVPAPVTVGVAWLGGNSRRRRPVTIAADSSGPVGCWPAGRVFVTFRRRRSSRLVQCDATVVTPRLRVCHGEGADTAGAESADLLDVATWAASRPWTLFP